MSNWQKIVKSVAPMLSKALSGPLENTAFGYIANHLLDKSGAKRSEVEQAIVNASPDTLKKLKSLDASFKQEMESLSIDIEGLVEKADKSSLSVFTLKQKGAMVNMLPQIFLSALFVMGYFFVLWYLMDNPSALPTGNPHLTGVFTTIIGVLTAAVPQILGFWFGSSLGSKEKTKELFDSDKSAG